MPVSKAKTEANRKWDEANRGRYWRATIVFPVEERPQVQEGAERMGKTVSDYVRDLVRADLRK